MPRSLDADEYWHRYFDRRRELTDRHAGDVRDQVAQWTSATAPDWAAPLVARDRDLTADLAVWRAGHNVSDSEQRPCGVRRADYAGWKAQRQLDRRINAVLGSADSATAGWKGSHRHAGTAHRLRKSVRKPANRTIASRQMTQPRGAGVGGVLEILLGLDTLDLPRRSTVPDFLHSAEDRPGPDADIGRGQS